MVSEPELAADDIQGHILPGFSGADLYVLALETTDPGALRNVLRVVAPHVSSLADGFDVRSARKLFLMNAGPAPDDPLRAALALTRRGLDLLGHVERGVDRAFDVGMSGVSTGDAKRPQRPDGSAEPGHPAHWLVGGPAHPFDLLVVLGVVNDVRGRVLELAERIKSVPNLSVVYEEFGEDLPESREHFGFADGISQPGVYGYFERQGAKQLVTTRYGVPSKNGLDFGKPGQPLVWPGRFIVGAPLAEGVAAPVVSPLWKNGSFLVFRRLQQDVAAFRADTDAMAQQLSASVPDVDGDLVRRFIVGRRPNGQPLMRTGTEADSLLAINYFNYQSAVPELTLSTGEKINGGLKDVGGRVCPVWAHVRKVNPRDGQNDLPEETHNLQMLRRGIPFGPAFDAADPASGQVSRGLLFLAYQRDIAEQFEKLNSHWMNQFEVPAFGGHDLLVGLALDDAGHLGPKRADWPGSPEMLRAERPWVVPTGGAYLFAPSRSVLRALGDG
jgi:Dyp-type peroxidase family